MPWSEKSRKRVDELIAQGNLLALEDPRWALPGDARTMHTMQGWMASALAVLEAVFTDAESAHRRAAHGAALVNGMGHKVGGINAVLKAMLADIDAGILGSVVNTAQAEILDGLVDQAEYFLASGHHEVAGVVAGVAFEDTVRRLCEKRSIGEKRAPGAKREELEQLFVKMERAGAITKLQGKHARVAGGVRTFATHADWTQFSARDVQATIDFTHELLRDLDRI